MKYNNTNNKNIYDDQYLRCEIDKIKEKKLSEISPRILFKPAIFSIILLIGSLFIDLSEVPILGNVSTSIAKYLYPSWSPAANAVDPMRFWWLPIISYSFFVIIAIKEYKGLFSHVRNTTPRENIDRIISSSISLIDGYSTALPLIGAAFLLVSIKLGPEIFLGIAVPFEIKALVVLAIAKLFEPVLDYIGVKFQKVINSASDFQEQYFRKIQLKQIDTLINIVSNGNTKKSIVEFEPDNIRKYREELEKIKTISFETYQNFSAVNKLSLEIKNNLSENENQLSLLNNLSQSIDSMATNLNNESVSKSLISLENIITGR